MSLMFCKQQLIVTEFLGLVKTLEVNGCLMITTSPIKMVIGEQNEGIIVVTCNYAPWIPIGFACLA